ncbi:protein disulfide-isomerase A4-like [Penaeus monodon]|uniref:protein disulfide-isomerase A4-like n=1 Tax=Penaeus monodon TaxID=6687 RepID=UPI0018A75A96|nr:protein disulfide-isomerase A4-like [Penaeus monodon]
MRTAIWVILWLRVVCWAAEEPSITIDPDGEIPVVEGFGGNIDIVEEDDVLVLTRDNFLHVVNPKDVILVEFYAPWCGHCKSLAPDYAAAARELKDDGIRLAKVDATKETELAKEHLVSGYPTIKLFKKGQPIEDYSGARTTQGIFYCRVLRMHADPNYQPPPSAVMVLTSANFSKTIKSKELILLEPEYEGAAKELVKVDIPLAKVDGPEEKELADEYGVSGYPTLLVFRNGRQFDFKGRRDLEGIIKSVLEMHNNMVRTDATVIGYFTEKGNMFEEYIGAANELRGITTATFKDIGLWIAKKSVPLVGQRTKSNKDFNMKLDLWLWCTMMLIFHINTQFIRNKILPVADANRGILFAIADEEEFEDEIKSLGLEDSGESVNVGLFSNNLKYPLEPEDDFSSDVLSEFIDEFKAANLKPFLKSQPIPKRQEGPVRIFVAKNFEVEVMQSKKDVLIEFYAPWCGHCKNLEPVYKKLAKHLSKSNEDVIVGKMDATANDVPPLFKVSGFPTIYYLRASEKDNPVPFTGERSLKKLKEFVEQESSIFNNVEDTQEETTKDEL